MNLPARHDWTVYRRTPFRCVLRWLPAGDGLGADLTGWSGVVRIGIKGGDVLAEDVLEVDGDGHVIAEIPAETTADLPLDVELRHEIDLTDPDGFVTRFLRGRTWVFSDVEPDEE